MAPGRTPTDQPAGFDGVSTGLAIEDPARACAARSVVALGVGRAPIGRVEGIRRRSSGSSDLRRTARPADRSPNPE